MTNVLCVGVVDGTYLLLHAPDRLLQGGGGALATPSAPGVHGSAVMCGNTIYGAEGNNRNAQQSPAGLSRPTLNGLLNRQGESIAVPGRQGGEIGNDPEIGFLTLAESAPEIWRMTSILTSLKGQRVRIFATVPELFEDYCRLGYLVEAFDPRDPAPLLDWLQREGELVLVVDGCHAMLGPLGLYRRKIILIRRHGRYGAEGDSSLLRSVDSFIAPFARLMEQRETPEWVRERTLYCGSLLRVGSAFGPPSESEVVALRQLEGVRRRRRPRVAVYMGDRIESEAVTMIRQGAEICTTWDWVVIGNSVERDQEGEGAWPENLQVVDGVNSPQRFLRLVDVVVGDADEKGMIEIALSGLPFICIPQQRPNDEQRVKGEVLRALDVATVLDRWPLPSEWCDWFEHAAARRSSLRIILDNRGAREAAAHIEKSLREG